LAGGNTSSRLRVRLRDACSFRSRMAHWRPRFGPFLSLISICELCFPVKAGILILTDQAAVSSRSAFGQRGVMLRAVHGRVKGNFRRARRQSRHPVRTTADRPSCVPSRMVHFKDRQRAQPAGRDAIRCDSSAG
jgi:hypothetical protein